MLVETTFMYIVYINTIHIILPFYVFYKQIKLTIDFGGNTFSPFKVLTFFNFYLRVAKGKKGAKF